MTKKNNRPTRATLQRFSINAAAFPKEISAWTLEMPFMGAAYDVRRALQSYTGKKKLYFPHRRLNNTLMAVAPLVHGFEWDTSARRYRALAVTTRQNEAKSEPESIMRVLHAWMLDWIRSFTKDDEESYKRISDAWLAETREIPSDFVWQPITIAELLGPDKATQSVRYQAVPSLLAALLHGKQTVIAGKTVQWVKVQDGGGKQLTLLGMIGNQPIEAFYAKKQGDEIKRDLRGYFSLKVEFSLQKQTGRAAPWMFMSLHVQRYGSQSLTAGNFRRRASLLVGGNKFRLDALSTDGALIRLPIERNGKKEWKWSDKLPTLLEKTSLETLEIPQAIVKGDPMQFWQSQAADEQRDEVYYLIHAEGYQYKRQRGNKVMAGVSLKDVDQVLEALLTQLPMLTPDAALKADTVQIGDLKPLPTVLKKITDWQGASNRLPRPFNEKELAERRAFRPILQQALATQLADQPLHIAVLYHNPDTWNGLETALDEAMKLDAADDRLDNIKVTPVPIDDARLLTKLDEEPVADKPYPRKAAHKQRVKQIRAWLKKQKALPSARPLVAIVELASNEDKKQPKAKYGTRSAFRDALSAEGINAQFLLPLDMLDDGQGGKTYNDRGKRHSRHRANAVAREAIVRQTGLMFGAPSELYTPLGIDHSLDIVTLYLKSTHDGIHFPIATKLRNDGRMFVRIPNQKAWIPYLNVGAMLGQLFSSQWQQVNEKWPHKLHKNSHLSLDAPALSQFAQETISDLSEPTLLIVEADKWRNQNVWPQLAVSNLTSRLDVLEFPSPVVSIERDLPQTENLVGIVRMRGGGETPQYVTETWRDFFALHGSAETIGDTFHYFSIGERMGTARDQREPVSNALESMLGETATGIAYKHPQVVEFVPFFLRADYNNPDGKYKLCRIAHFLRFAPHWKMGNTILPYPMHLAKALIEDQLCILAMDD